MRNSIRWYALVLAWFVTIISILMTFIIGLKVIIYGDLYDPRDGIITFMILNGVSICILLIRMLIPPDRNVDRGYSDFGTNCSTCYESMDDCQCYRDDEE